MGGISYSFLIQTDSSLTDALKDVLHSLSLQLNLIAEPDRVIALGDGFEMIGYFLPERGKKRMGEILGFIPNMEVIFDYGKFYNVAEVGLLLANAFIKLSLEANYNSILIVDGSLIILMNRNNSVYLNAREANYLKSRIEDEIEFPFELVEIPF